MMNESQYEMILYWDKTDKIFVVDIPELPCCMAHGKTKKQAIDNAEIAFRCV
ncbi:MAG: type II toxin-antitoxin system HicB family antitoxin [Candidatus Scalindua sp.]|nr:type II toxin-antitoxin system HicB family antitoxin [Candidatus Scalindua sp.]